ncbi:MAG: Gfo/Idh/MocA family oxidoreductase, partial [Phycisphaerae bacterium]|nr:Gfo/Idh/MocA family oxidoreductase [Phycisphaerae bacterium]
MPQTKRRYAQVGLGSRSGMYTKAVTGEFKDFCELVALCDVNQGRMNLANRLIEENGAKPAATYKAEEFDKLIAETRPDVVIVTTGPDATHSDYICRAMELGCDVVTEKPMTTDDVQCRRILKTAAETGRDLHVTFNYRYAPPRSQIRELIMGGAIGEVLSVDFAWMLDTRHGADYFRRWHRRRANSGSLLVHKATHHFDLVNWWLDDVPGEVFSHASLAYYAPATAEKMGLANRSERCRNCSAAERCKFYLNLADSENMKEMYLDCEDEPNGYIRDKCVFSDEIDIWDNMSVAVRYESGA